MRDGGAHNVDEVHLVIPCWCVLKQEPESVLSSCCSVADLDLWHVKGEQERTGFLCREPYIVSVSQPCVKIAQRDALVGARCLRYNWDCEMRSVWPKIIKAYQIRNTAQQRVILRDTSLIQHLRPRLTLDYWFKHLHLGSILLPVLVSKEVHNICTYVCHINVLLRTDYRDWSAIHLDYKGPLQIYCDVVPLTPKDWDIKWKKQLFFWNVK